MRTSRWVIAGTLVVAAAGSVGAAPAGGGEIRVSGVVQAGVEPRCYLLPAPGREPYLLVGGDRAVIKPGAHVVVRGRPDPGAPTTCMQGTPLHVREAHPA